MLTTQTHPRNLFFAGIIFILGSATSMSFGQQNSQGGNSTVDIQPAETAELEAARREINADNAVLLDVREADEREVERFKKTVHVATSSLQDESGRAAAIKQLTKDKPIYCHCRKGGRAQRVAAMLRDLGYDARAIAIPFEDIKAAGFETEP
jgi:phage shock protein E